MGRKTKNPSKEIFLAFDEDTIPKIFDVKVPYYYELTVRPLYPENVEQCLICTTSMLFKSTSLSDPEVAMKEAREHGLFPLEAKQSFVQLIDLCPRCHQRGIPKIEIKDNTDRRVRSWSSAVYKLTKKDDEYWLTYDHKSKSKKCRIGKLVFTPQIDLIPNKRQKIDIKQCLFPYAIEYLKLQRPQYGHST